MKIRELGKLTVLSKVVTSDCPFQKGIWVIFNVTSINIFIYCVVRGSRINAVIDFRFRVFKTEFEINDGILTIHYFYLLPIGGHYERTDVRLTN